MTLVQIADLGNAAPGAPNPIVYETSLFRWLETGNAPYDSIVIFLKVVSTDDRNWRNNTYDLPIRQPIPNTTETTRTQIVVLLSAMLARAILLLKCKTFSSFRGLCRRGRFGKEYRDQITHINHWHTNLKWQFCSQNFYRPSLLRGTNHLEFFNLWARQLRYRTIQYNRFFR